MYANTIDLSRLERHYRQDIPVKKILEPYDNNVGKIIDLSRPEHHQQQIDVDKIFEQYKNNIIKTIDDLIKPYNWSLHERLAQRFRFREPPKDIKKNLEKTFQFYIQDTYYERQKNPVKITKQDLLIPPKKTRLDELASFVVFGLDFKITPENEVKLIEINGLTSGMNGFEKAKSCYYDMISSLHLSQDMNKLISSIPQKKTQEDVERERLKLKYPDVTILRRPSRKKPKIIYSCAVKEQHTSPEQMLIEHLRNYGEEQIAYIGGVLLLHRNFPSRMLGGELMLQLAYEKINDVHIHDNKKYTHPEFNKRYETFAETLCYISKILCDKKRTDDIFENTKNARKYKPFSFEFNSVNKELFEQTDLEYIVIKPRKGSMGKKVEVVEKEKFSEIEPKGSKFIIEPFIPSKPIYSELTQANHDGCMRYVILIEEEKSGDIKINHFGGYWRLCPAPLNGKKSPYKSPKSRIANLRKKAIPQRASSKDLKLVYDAINNFIPKVYKIMIEAIKPRKVFFN